jgi:hypothetical protein
VPRISSISADAALCRISWVTFNTLAKAHNDFRTNHFLWTNNTDAWLLLRIDTRSWHNHYTSGIEPWLHPLFWVKCSLRKSLEGGGDSVSRQEYKFTLGREVLVLEFLKLRGGSCKRSWLLMNATTECSQGTQHGMESICPKQQIFNKGTYIQCRTAWEPVKRFNSLTWLLVAII